MYGAQKQDSRVIINRINELPEPVQFFIREVLKKQYVPVAAIFYQDVEPYKINEWDDYWDGGEYEVLIVLDGDWESEDFYHQRSVIAKASIKTDERFGDIYADTTPVGYWVNDLEGFWTEAKLEYTYPRFMVDKGTLVYATSRFFAYTEHSTAGIFGTTTITSQDLLHYARIWFNIGDLAFSQGYYSHSAYLFRLAIELSLKGLIFDAEKIYVKTHNLEKLYYKASESYHDLISNVDENSIKSLYKQGADFRYPDSSWIPTKEDIENLFRPTAKKVLDYVSSKISQ